MNFYIVILLAVFLCSSISCQLPSERLSRISKRFIRFAPNYAIIRGTANEICSAPKIREIKQQMEFYRGQIQETQMKLNACLGP